MDDDIEKERSFYLTIFISVLVFTLISTVIVYYLVRYKKKFYFDAAGRKFIVISEDFSNFVNRLSELIKTDDRQALESLVVGNNKSIILLYFIYLLFR
jgi:hypothetical protein